MRAGEVAETLRAALGEGVPVRMVRLADVSEAGLAVLIRLAGRADGETLDPSIRAQAGGYELQCRSPTCEGANALGDDVLAALSGRLVSILEDGDDPDTPSAERGRYYARTLVLRLA